MFLLRGVSCSFFSFIFLFIFFFSPFNIVITLLGEERAGLRVSCVFVCLFGTRYFLSFFSYSWCQGLAAACDCGTPLTFLLNLILCDC